MHTYNDTTWQQEYEDLMFGPLHSSETMNRAAEIKHSHMPDLLFKYRSCSDNTFEALEHDFLYSSQPSGFNDIFEGAIEIFSEKAQIHILRNTYNKLKSNYPYLIDRPINSRQDLIDNLIISHGGLPQEINPHHPLFFRINELLKISDFLSENCFRKIQHEARNMYNVCCFCAENNSETMWAYYADSHKGFCIGYDIKGPNNERTHLTMPVLYKDHCTLLIDDIDQLNGSVCMHLLTEKSIAWRHEKEWRTFFPANAPYHKEIMPTAKAVYLGARISPENESCLKSICNRKQIKIFKMVPHISGYKLIPVELV